MSIHRMGDPRKSTPVGETWGAEADAIYTLLLPVSCSGGQYIQSLILQRTESSKTKEKSVSMPSTCLALASPDAPIRVTSRTPPKEAPWGPRPG